MADIGHLRLMDLSSKVEVAMNDIVMMSLRRKWEHSEAGQTLLKVRGAQASMHSLPDPGGLDSLEKEDDHDHHNLDHSSEKPVAQLLDAPASSARSAPASYLVDLARHGC